jgi:hypothetical protein
MRALPVVRVLPESELVREVGRFKVDGRVELGQVGLVGALDLAIEVG